MDDLRVSEQADEIRREGATMALYVSIVLLAELAVLPSGDKGNTVHGPSGGELIALVWGTTLGLAIAHLFAFDLASRHLRKDPSHHRRMMLAQLAGAAVVAVATTIPILLFQPSDERRIVLYIPALVIGSFGYYVARQNGHPRHKAVLAGAGALVVGLLVATLKVVLAH
jgi:hypothetical protein